MATLSFAGGAVLGALLLKSQEIFVRRVIRPKDASTAHGLDTRIPIALLLPVKYIIIGVAFALLLDRDLLQPVAFAIGFMTLQIVIVSKVLGRLLAHRIRPVSEVVQREAWREQVKSNVQ